MEPWSGELGDQSTAERRSNVVVEVEGKRIEVSLPARLLSGGAGESGGPPPPPPPAPRRRGGAHSVDTATGDSLTAPMQATVVKVAVADGDPVVKGDLVLV